MANLLQASSQMAPGSWPRRYHRAGDSTAVTLERQSSRGAGLLILANSWTISLEENDADYLPAFLSLPKSVQRPI